MLSREDSRRLAQLERQLRQDDPEFCARMEGAQIQAEVEALARRRRFSITLILTVAVIGVAAVVLAVVGWWIPAGIAALCAAVVMVALFVRARRFAKSRPAES